jgi:exodeoxyribonuclease V alpha subunit
MLEDLQGQIERVTFHNDETGFTIARLKVKGFRELSHVPLNSMRAFAIKPERIWPLRP